MRCHNARINGIRGVDGQFVTISNDLRIKRWDLSEDYRIREKQEIKSRHYRHLESLEISEEGDLMLTGGSDSSVRIWDIGLDYQVTYGSQIKDVSRCGI